MNATTTDRVARQDALDTAARHAHRLVRAYGWLHVLTTPGRDPRPAPPLLTDSQHRAAATRAAAEAVDRVATLRAGMSAAPAGAVPLRLGMVATRAATVRAVADLAARLVVAGVPPFGDPVTERNLPYVVDWIAGDGGPRSWAAPAAGPAYRRGVLADDVVNARLVDLVATALRGAAERARQAAGIVEDAIAPYPNQPCPACRRRSLQIDATLPAERYWTVRCISAACRCTGLGCPCDQPVRIEGRGHVWTYADLPRLALAQQRIRLAHPVRSAATGHGGWASRRRGDR